MTTLDAEGPYTLVLGGRHEFVATREKDRSESGTGNAPYSLCGAAMIGGAVLNRATLLCERRPTRVDEGGT